MHYIFVYICRLKYIVYEFVMQRQIKIYWILAVVLGFCFLHTEEAKAQRLAVSTNAIEWLTVSPNVSLDIVFTQHHSLAVSASSSPWKLTPNVYLRHFTLSPEYKYWLNMPFYKSYIGGKILYSSYDLGANDFLRKGNMVAGLIDYGYSFIFSKRFNLVPNVGLGVGYNIGEHSKVVPMVTLGLNAQIVLK